MKNEIVFKTFFAEKKCKEIHRRFKQLPNRMSISVPDNYFCLQEMNFQSADLLTMQTKSAPSQCIHCRAKYQIHCNNQYRNMSVNCLLKTPQVVNYSRIIADGIKDDFQ